MGNQIKYKMTPSDLTTYLFLGLDNILALIVICEKLIMKSPK